MAVKEKVITGSQLKDLLNQIGKSFKDDFFKNVSEDAYLCIDSIRVKNKSKEEISKEKRVTRFLINESLREAIFDSSNVANVNTENKQERKRAYFGLERYLRDSCKGLQEIVVTNEKESIHSVSTNELALKYYYEGTATVKKKDYRKAEKLLRKAVETDKYFAFAWGI